MAAVRPRCRGEGVSQAIIGKRGRELKTPAVGLRSRRCVVKPDPITPHGQSSRGAAEGEGRFPTAIAAAIFMLVLIPISIPAANEFNHETFVFVLHQNLKETMT